MSISVAEQPTSTAAPAAFDIEPLGGCLGAQIHGLDLKCDMSAQTVLAFEAALIAHKVLVLRDQPLTTAEHVAVSRHFGDLEVHPMRPRGEFAEILVLDN